MAEKNIVSSFREAAIKNLKDSNIPTLHKKYLLAMVELTETFGLEKLRECLESQQEEIKSLKAFIEGGMAGADNLRLQNENLKGKLDYKAEVMYDLEKENERLKKAIEAVEAEIDNINTSYNEDWDNGFNAAVDIFRKYLRRGKEFE